MMKITEIRAQSDEKLSNLLDGLHNQLAQLLMDMRTKDTKSNHQIKQLRRDIARILTILRERQLNLRS